MTESIDYDHFADVNLFPVWKHLRETCPVAHSDDMEGFWIASRHAEIAAIARDPELFSSRYVTVPPQNLLGDLALPPLTLDPPEHGPIKAVLTSAFTPKRVAPLEPVVREIVVDAIGMFATKGACDASHEFARVVPLYTIARLLGLPKEDDPKFTDWVHRAIELQGTDESLIAGFEVLEYFSELVEQRQASPGEDFVSYLTQAEIDGEPMADSDIILSSMSVLLAGIDTTWSVLGFAIKHLAEDQELQQRLREDPGLIESAREEFLRFYAPVTVARQATRDTERGGCPIKAEEMVLIPFPSANRDPEAFPDPDTFDVERSPNKHVAFGLGVHRCLGVNLARLELSIALEELLARIPQWRLDPAGEVRWAVGQIRGPRALPILFGD